MEYLTLFVICIIVAICKIIDKILWSHKYVQNLKYWDDQPNEKYWEEIEYLIQEVNPSYKNKIYKPHKRNILRAIEQMSHKIKIN